jgi:hypothetical protein
MSFSWLPPLLAEIAEVAGLEAALAMADQRGGSRISLPARPGPNHWLVQAVGPEAAKAICKHFRTGASGSGGAVLDLPCRPDLTKLRRAQKVDQLIASGLSADTIARETGAHRTTVFRRKARLQDGAAPSDQPDLFDLFD